jgi:hypothetical protein
MAGLVCGSSAASAISTIGAQRIQALRQLVDQEAGPERELRVCADATFTNRTVLKALPPRTVLIGRIRKDARLFALPTVDQENHGRGRHRCYGDPLPTPEQYRQNQSLGWKQVRAFAAGRTHTFHLKVVSPVRWKHAGGDRQLQLIIVRAVPYRLRKWGPRSYRRPAYLICTDPTLSPQQILQAYLWRWEIAVNFRDQKTLLGLGQPQVRTEPAVRTTASFAVFIYALLLLALHRCRLAHSPLPPPRWQRPNPKRAPSPGSPLNRPLPCSAPNSGPPHSDSRIKTASLHHLLPQRSHSQLSMAFNRPCYMRHDSQTRERGNQLWFPLVASIVFDPKFMTS